MIWIGIVAVVLLAGLCLRHYFLNHCLECKKRTDWKKYDSCDECKTKHEARVKEYEKEHEERVRAMIHEMFERTEADQKEFGFSDWEFLDKPCTLCGEGEPKTHRVIMRERGFSGDHKKCWDFIWNTHMSLSRKAHEERESRKFWKRWLYIPASKEEEAAIGRLSWKLQNMLSEGLEGAASLREYEPYTEKPDHWMDMTVKQLLRRRLAHAKNALFTGND